MPAERKRKGGLEPQRESQSSDATPSSCSPPRVIEQRQSSKESSKEPTIRQRKQKVKPGDPDDELEFLEHTIRNNQDLLNRQHNKRGLPQQLIDTVAQRVMSTFEKGKNLIQVVDEPPNESPEQVEEKMKQKSLLPLLFYCLVCGFLLMSYDKCDTAFSRRTDCGYAGITEIECIHFARFTFYDGCREYWRVSFIWSVFALTCWRMSGYEFSSLILYGFLVTYMTHFMCGCCHDNDRSVPPGTPHCFY